ncbi:MAG: InlB B-repeat-containing protein [Bacteroidales bacterium]|nr:InlB B-repeat-containing protein [Bacteroidales bacterium]
MTMSIRKYIYASLAFICLMSSCDPWLVPPVKITYEEDANGHKYVDLGLSVKWAAYDIGANSATELGDFFAWGETQPKKESYYWATYKFAVPYKSPESGTGSFDNGYGIGYELTKYNLNPNSEYYDGKTTLDLIDDAAHIAWGGNWRMPTADECEELLEKCEWTWTEYLGMGGYDVKGPNGNRIFLPIMEGRDMLYQDGILLYRWSSNCLNSTHYYAYMMAGNGVISNQLRCFSLFVRAVYDKALPKYSVLTFDANGGEGLMHPQQFNKGVSQSIDSVRYTNGILNFVAWNTQPDGSGTSYTDGQEITLTEDVTLYAQWALANGEENGYGYVDLGLPSGTKWAIYNVGATSPECYGDYFAWGETAPKSNYDWSTYKYCKGSENTITKYYIRNDLGTGDEKTILDFTDDAARVNWGGKWRMPTDAEIRELINHCSWVWTTQNGANGYLVTSKKNANKLFLPAAGYRNATTLVGDGSFGDYWTRLCPWGSYSYGANYLRFNSGEIDDYYNRERYYGHTVRAVFSENSTFVTITFDANGGEGTMSAQTFEEGVSQALAANTFSRSGYYFSGWNTAPDASGTSYTDGQEITLTEDVTLYAQWALNTSENGYEWVDLGLPSGTKWATCNVGATSPEGYGDYFAWGEIAPKDDYSWETYKYCKGSKNTLTKYNTDSNYGTVDNKTTLDLSDDAARANWGGNWRMPTAAECNELFEKCEWTWTTQNGINGCKVTSKTSGNSIFLPATGYSNGTYVGNVGSRGNYWSSSLDSSEPSRAGQLSFDSSVEGVFVNSGPFRGCGRTIRAVFSENDTPSTFVTLTFDANGGSGAMSAQLFEAGVTQTLAPNKFTRSGYYFAGWNTAPDGSGTSYTDGQEITLTEDVTLYAQWALNTGSENGYEWVDLGLPSGLKWATCNVGATTPEGYGDYFAWGETSPKDNYDWSTYKYCNGSEDTMIKYCTRSSYGYNGFTDNKTTLDLSDDAARANWSGKWRMPTKADQDELRINCTWTWTTQNGVNGYKVTSKTNGNSIFLPAAGYCSGTFVPDVGSRGYYWSSSLHESYPYSAYILSSSEGWYNGRRCGGHTVRAVRP